MSTNYRKVYLVGRCANGAQRDAGPRIHAVPGDSAWDTALCGAQPGRRSNGWSDVAYDAVTCPKCIKRLAVLERKAVAA